MCDTEADSRGVDLAAQHGRFGHEARLSDGKFLIIDEIRVLRLVQSCPALDDGVKHAEIQSCGQDRHHPPIVRAHRNCGGHGWICSVSGVIERLQVKVRPAMVEVRMSELRFGFLGWAGGGHHFSTIRLHDKQLREIGTKNTHVRFEFLKEDRVSRARLRRGGRSGDEPDRFVNHIRMAGDFPNIGHTLRDPRVEPRLRFDCFRQPLRHGIRLKALAPAAIRKHIDSRQKHGRQEHEVQADP